MWVKRLLLLGFLLAVGQGLVASASAPQGGDRSPLNASSSPANRSVKPPKPLNPAIPETPATPEPSPGGNATPSAVSPAIRNPLLSTLILPLPPLLLPDLLLPPYNFPSFNSQRLDQELQIYSRYLRIYGAPDVLIVGSSRSLQGIDPTALQEGLAAQGHKNVTVFNFGINGATAQVVDLLLSHVLTQEQLPKLIIWGDGLRAFNDGRADLTYDEIIASDGYRRLATGDRPIPARTYYQESASRRTTAGKSFASVSNTPPASSEFETTAPTTSALTQQAIAPDLNMFGFQAVAQQFNPTTYYQRYPKVPGDYDADYVPFALGGEQTQATIAVAQFARQHNISLVLVNLPLTQDYLDTPRLQYERQFRQHMQQLAHREKFTLIDLVQQPNLSQNQYFADPSHINQQGARAVALHLATHPQVPWQILGTEAEPEANGEAQIEQGK